jgi:two-component system sensor histidine kinase VicK
VIVVVRAQGVEIPPDQLEEILEKFVQSRNNASDGTGTRLGLAICQQMVEGHGGKVWASNNSEGGASF